MIDWNIQMDGADRLLTQNSLNLIWQDEARQHEMDIATEKRETQVGFWIDNDYDYFTLARTSDKKFEKPLQWLSVKQKFFNTTLIAKNNFNSGEINCASHPDSTHIITKATANLKIILPAGSKAIIPMQIYYGPNDYKILSSYNSGHAESDQPGPGHLRFCKIYQQMDRDAGIRFLQEIY